MSNLSSLFFLQCDIALQDCETLWPPVPGHIFVQVLPWQNGSCVLDTRIPGNVGRCGWPGAPCTVKNGSSNCGWGLAQICHNSVCAGAVGSSCTNSNDCNYGIDCNITTTSPTAICGGAGAETNGSDAAKGLNFGADYCVSGMAVLDANGNYICSSGLSTITPILSTTNIAASSVATQPARPTNSALLGAAIGGPFGKVVIMICLAVTLATM